MEGWIKLYRKFSEWEWFNISEMVHLFIYLLLNANHENGKWRGIEIKRGQILTGLHSLNEKTGISIRTIRTCLDRLQNTKEIDRQTTNKYSIITICNYESYQINGVATDKHSDKQLTSKRQTTDKQTTTNKNEENDNNKKNDKEEEFTQLVFECDPLKYSPDICKEFIDYWTEKRKDSKMRYELEKVFEISKRLATWKKNDEKFNKSTKKEYHATDF